MVSMKLEDAQVHRMRLIPGLQLQVILLILSGAPGLASANGTRCCGISRISVVETIAAPAAQRAVVYLNPKSAIRNGKTGEVRL